jgi:hypothetical protein
MAFLGIRGKQDTGLAPIVQRAPSTVASLSNVSAYLVQPKAVVRTAVVAPPPPPPPPPRIEAPRPQPIVARAVAAPVRVEPPRPIPAPKPVSVTWGGARRGDDLAHLRKGVVLQARGEHAAAIEEFTKAIAADAGCVEAYAGRGISSEALGDVARAKSDYAKSIEVEVKAGIAAHLAVAREIGI